MAACPAIAMACEPWQNQFRERDALIVGDINIIVNDVFSQREDESKLIHRLTNRFHIQSRDSLIEAQLLFSEGDAFDQDVLLETERNLRRNAYLRSADITPIRVCGNVVDIQVETGDNWTLLPSINFSRAGGENELALSLSERNLFGLGKSIGIELDYGRVRDQQVLQYLDPMLFGTQIQFGLQLQNNTDGNVQKVEFEKPFTSLDTRRSWQLRVGNTEYEQNLYDNGFRTNQLAVDYEFASVKTGFSAGKRLAYRRPDGNAVFRVVRYSVGWQYARRELGPTDLFPDTEAIARREFNYPFIEVDVLQPSYIEQSNLQLMESVEDINLGHTLQTRIGLVSESLGSTFNAVQSDVDYSKAWQLGERVLTMIDTSLSGYLTNNGIQNGLASTTLQGFYFFSRKNRLYSSANFVAAANLFEQRQIVIGGGTGLRGYPLNFQSGSRRARVTLEQRYFFDWYPLRLARVGAAAFFDSGSAWEKDKNPRWLSDVGFGLRIVGTRQANAKVMHIDFAFPLNETDRIDSFQLVVSAKTQF